MSATGARRRMGQFWQIKRFVQLEGSLPAECLKDIDRTEGPHSPKPDATIPYRGELLGIEHTRIIRSHKSGFNLLRAFEGDTDRIVTRAQEAFEAEREERVCVQVCFDSRKPLKKSDPSVSFQAIASGIANVVAHAVPPVGERVRLDRRRFRAERQSFSDAVEMIWIDHRPEQGTPHWTVLRPANASDLSAEVVQREIERKEKKLEKYRQYCSTVWLLLVIEGFAPSSYWNMERFPFDHSFAFSFDKAFLYHQFNAAYWELARR